VRVYDPIQQLAVVDEDVLERFEVDTIELGRAFAIEKDIWADWILPDGTPCQIPRWALPEREEDRWVLRSKSGCPLAIMSDGALYFEQVHWPFNETYDLEAIPKALDESMWTAVAAPPGPLVAGPGGDRILADGARNLRKTTDRAIIALFGGNLLEMGQFLFGNERFFLMLMENPHQVHLFLDKLLEIHLDNLEHFLGAVKDYIDIILFGDDLGMQTGPQISPDMFREFFKPRYKQMWSRAKELADVYVMLHCCGGVRELIPDMIEAGLDAINPVQISCAGMDPKGLKKDFGAALTLWGGGCDTQQILVKGTPDIVRQHVMEQIQILSPGGGFVFQQVHNILAYVPPENIIAMFDTVRDTPR